MGLLAVVLLCVLLHAAFNHGLIIPGLAGGPLRDWQERGVRAVLFLTLMPLGMTLALLWKIKESIFAGLFQVEG